MNLAQTANRLAQVILSEKTPMPPVLDITETLEYEAFQRFIHVLSAILINTMMKGDKQMTITRPSAEAVDTLVREMLVATGFTIDIDSRPGTIIINWK